MPTKRPVAEALARATKGPELDSEGQPLEALPEFPMPQHPPLCNAVMSGGLEPCDCGIADAIQTNVPLRVNGTEVCGYRAPWGVQCTSEVEHRGSHSWQDQDRFPAASTSTEAFTPLKDAEEVFGPKPAIRQVDGNWTAIELAGMPSPQPKGNVPMTSTAATVSMSATLKRLGYKSGTQADPDAYVEMVIRTNDLSVGAELGWQTGKTLTVTMQPEQPRLNSAESIPDPEDDASGLPES